MAEPPLAALIQIRNIPLDTQILAVFSDTLATIEYYKIEQNGVNRHENEKKTLTLYYSIALYALPLDSLNEQPTPPQK